MRFHATYAVVGTLSAVLLLGACGSSDPAPPSPTSAAPTPASPSPTIATAPLLPEAAKAHTKAGAEAFVRHFWAVVNYAQETGDTEPISELSADGCKACEAGIAGIRKVYEDGGRYSGGTNTVLEAAGDIRQTDEQRFAYVHVRLRVATLGITFNDGKPAVSQASGTFDEGFDLIAVPGTWLVGQFRRV